MVKNLFLSIALAAGLIFVAAADRAEAAMVSPAVTAPDTAQSGLVETVRWRCGPGACWWTPGYTGYVPPYAYGWGPPHRPHCFWRVGRRGAWRYDC